MTQNKNLIQKTATILVFLILLSQTIFAATVSHPAPQIDAGTFAVGDYTFQDNLIVNKNITIGLSTLHVYSNGNRVGIGTSSPRTELQIGNFITTPQLLLAGPNNNLANSELLFADSGGGTAPYYNGMGIRYDSPDNKLYIDDNYGGGSSANNVLISIERDLGNVGIGTTNPISGTKLDISGDIRISGPNNYAVGGDQARLYLGNKPLGIDGYAGIMAERSFGLKFGVWKIGGAGSFGTDSIDALVIEEASGNVGIGTTNPTSKLHIEGSLNVSQSFNLPIEAPASPQIGDMWLE